MTCCVCLSDQYQPFLEAIGHQIVRCQRCEFLYVRPRPSREQIDAFYQDPAYFQGESAYGYTSYVDERRDIERRAAERLALIERLTEPGRLLDVGCASGYFLHVARARGWQIEGVELSEVVAPRAEQLLGQRIHPSLDAASLSADSFDAVTMWEYIEHVLNPRDELLQARRWLRPGGLLALSTPNAGQRLVTQHPDAWREFKPPEHLQFFTVKTLTRLLCECGFEPLRIRGIAPDIRSPERAQQWIDRLRQSLGDRHSRSTPLWWLYSIARRLLVAPTVLRHRVFMSRFDYHQGIEVYARKRLMTGP